MPLPAAVTQGLLIPQHRSSFPRGFRHRTQRPTPPHAKVPLPPAPSTLPLLSAEASPPAAIRVLPTRQLLALAGGLCPVPTSVTDAPGLNMCKAERLFPATSVCMWAPDRPPRGRDHSLLIITPKGPRTGSRRRCEHSRLSGNRHASQTFLPAASDFAGGLSSGYRRACLHRPGIWPSPWVPGT